MIKKEKVFNFFKNSKMKKSILVFSLAFTFALFTIQSFAQSQTQGASAPEDMGINVYIGSEDSGCPSGGQVEGSIAALSGNWWPATPVNYTGPHYYFLHVPNANASCGYGGAWAETNITYVPSGSFWCEGGGTDFFNLLQNDFLQVYFDMEMEYNPDCED